MLKGSLLPRRLITQLFAGAVALAGIGLAWSELWALKAAGLAGAAPKGGSTRSGRPATRSERERILGALPIDGEG